MNRRGMLAGTASMFLGVPWRRGQRDADVRARVEATERAFADTMARRDFAAFQSFLSDEAIFIGNAEPASPARGKRAIADRWRPFFEGPRPPFSWAPDLVEALDSGTLALTSGLVKNADGAPIGRFTSIWRRDADGSWRIVFDRGSVLCTGRP